MTSNENPNAASYTRAKTSQDVISIYDQWSGNYEKDILSLGYCVPSIMAATLERLVDKELKLNKSCSILDIGAGTGMLGDNLRAKGFTGKIDALDGSLKMLEMAKKKQGLYDQHICHYIKPGTAWPDEVICGSYGIAAITGTMLTPTFISYECLIQFVKVVRVGGLIAFDMKTPASDADLEYNISIEREAFRLQKLGIWMLMDMKFTLNSRMKVPDSQEPETISVCTYFYKKIKDME